MKRERILEAATVVFDRDGLKKASMRLIAIEAGCTTGAIYHLFSGKEDLYFCLLKNSLRKLHNSIAVSVAQEPDALAALHSAAKAFYHYYVNNKFEYDLGMYLFGDLEIKGLGTESDRFLNALLLESLDLFKACFIRLAPVSMKGEEADKWATEERDALFAALIGVLMLSRTGRDHSIGSTADTILERILMKY